MHDNIPCQYGQVELESDALQVLLSLGDVEKNSSYVCEDKLCHLLIKDNDIKKIDEELLKLNIRGLYFSQSKNKYIEVDIYPVGIECWGTNLMRNNIPILFESTKICEVTNDFYDKIKSEDDNVAINK